MADKSERQSNGMNELSKRKLLDGVHGVLDFVTNEEELLSDTSIEKFDALIDISAGITDKVLAQTVAEMFLSGDETATAQTIAGLRDEIIKRLQEYL